MKTIQLCLFLLLIHQLYLGSCDVCSESFKFECLSSGNIIVNPKENVTAFGPSVNTTTGNNFTIPAKDTEHVKLFGGNVTKIRITKPELQDCYIMCKDLNINQSYIINGNIQSSFHLPKQQNEVGAVEMRLRRGRNELSSEISNTYVGDTIYMFLKYVGKTNYALQPTNCTAYSGNVVQDSKHNLPLWTKSKCNTPVINYFSPFKRIDRQTVSAKISVFKFLDSEDVTFLCSVQICHTCSIGQNCVNPKTKRRRQKYLTTDKTLRITERPSYVAHSAGTALRLWNIVIYVSVLLAMA